MADGSLKTIENIKANEEVYAFDCNAYHYCSKTVKSIKTGQTGTLVTVDLVVDESEPAKLGDKDFASITVGAGHLLFTGNG
jgi:hypothetical protein